VASELEEDSVFSEGAGEGVVSELEGGPVFSEGAGEGVASELEEASDFSAGVGENWGALAVSGRRDAGGGKEGSASDAGNGDAPRAESRGWELSLFASLFASLFSPFSFSVFATEIAGCRAASPIFARISSTRFFDLSPSTEPGCCRITSL
jgi:hypothetical protein